MHIEIIIECGVHTNYEWGGNLCMYLLVYVCFDECFECVSSDLQLQVVEEIEPLYREQLLYVI